MKDLEYSYSGFDDISGDFEGPAQAIEKAIEIMEELLARPRWKRVEGVEYFKLRCYLPYALHATKEEGVRILLGRNYKPLGHNGKSKHPHVDYKEYTNLHIRASSKALEFLGMDDSIKVIGFYGDGNTPWRNRKCAKAYLKRLQNLQFLC